MQNLRDRVVLVVYLHLLTVKQLILMADDPARLSESFYERIKSTYSANLNPLGEEYSIACYAG